MKIITKYLLKEISGTTWATAIILLLVFLSTQVLRFMHSVAYGHLAKGALKLIILLQLPILAVLVIPVALYLGVILGYGRLYADSEMIILSACGVTQKRIRRIALSVAWVVGLSVAVLSLWVNPEIYKYFDQLNSGGVANPLELVKANCFNELANGRWIFYVKEVSNEQQNFRGIIAFQQQNLRHNDQAKLLTLVAERAYQTVKDNGERYLVLVNGARYLGRPGECDYEVVKFTEYGLRLTQPVLSPYKDESGMKLKKLWQNRHVARSAAELQWRISLPLAAWILIMFAVPLSKIPPRQGRYARLAPAILIYVLYINGLFLSRTWVRIGTLATWPGMLWVHMVMLLFLSLVMLPWYKMKRILLFGRTHEVSK